MGKAKKTIEELQQIYAAAGYKLLADVYTNSESKMPIQCPEGHTYPASWASFRNGGRCQQCKNTRLRETYRDDPATVRQAIESAGFQLLDEYHNSHSKMQMICPAGHTVFMKWMVFKRGHRCFTCANIAKGAAIALSDEARSGRNISARIAAYVRRQVKTKLVERPRSLSSATAIARPIAAALLETLGAIPAGYEIDHLIPSSYFDLTQPDQIFACWSLCNLRYLPRQQNRDRRNNLTIADVEQFTPEQLNLLKIAQRKPKQWGRLNGIAIAGN